MSPSVDVWGREIGEGRRTGVGTCGAPTFPVDHWRTTSVKECFRMVELWGNIPVILVLFSWLACLQPEHTSGCGGCRLRVAQRGRGPEATEGERKGGLGSPATAHAGNIQQACGTKHRRPWEQEKKVGRNSMDGPNRLGLRCWQAQRGDFTSLTGRLAIADEAAAGRPHLLPPLQLQQERGGRPRDRGCSRADESTGCIHPALECIHHPQPLRAP